MYLKRLKRKLRRRSAPRRQTCPLPGIKPARFLPDPAETYVKLLKTFNPFSEIGTLQLGPTKPVPRLSYFTVFQNNSILRYILSTGSNY